MLKGFLISLLVSLFYFAAVVFMIFNPLYGPMFWPLAYTFIPVFFGANIGGMAVHLKTRYHSLRGIGRYGAGVAVVAILDFGFVFVLFILLLFVLTAGSGGQ